MCMREKVCVCGRDRQTDRQTYRGEERHTLRNATCMLFFNSSNTETITLKKREVVTVNT